ncbi:MAG: hypothetical protein RSB77_01945 [Bacilli bacterium]
MCTLTKENNNILETLISIFTIDKGELKVLLSRKKNDPFKGYWTLPGNFLKNTETIEENIENVILNNTGLNNVYIEQCFTFSNLNRNIEDRIIATTFIGLIDSKSVEMKNDLIKTNEFELFSIDEVPKMGYDHEEVITKNIEFLKKKIINSNVLKSLFPSDFTLPELQRVYEQILGKELDRRNFRKKFISLDLIEDTNEKNIGCNGRPAKLYRFKDEIKEINLF